MLVSLDRSPTRIGKNMFVRIKDMFVRSRSGDKREERVLCLCTDGSF
jgi:hypothetical protein